MKKALIIIIALLLAFSMAFVLFVVGLEWTRNNSSGNKEKTEETQKYRTDIKEEKKTEDAVTGDRKYKEDDDSEEKKGVVIDEEKKGVVVDEKKDTNDKKEEPATSENSGKWYRVRKSSGDSKSQKGAFQSLDNAKALADQYKSEGYEVYDGNKCVYTP